MHDRTMAAVLLLLPMLGASVAAQADTITEGRVLETVSWLADDARRGRGTGSVELDAAADWLAARFAAAGLRQAQEGTWFADFELRGLQLDSGAAKLSVTQKFGGETASVVLQPNTDFRLWTASDAVVGSDEACTVALADDPVLQQLLNAAAARRPILIEVPEEHPFWQKSAGVHAVFGGRKAASRPVFLVRSGLLPALPNAGRDQLVEWLATWSVAAAEPGPVKQHNVVALLPGGDRKDEYVVVSAHYDHLGTGRPVEGDGIYNGADDDASGTTAVVLLAEAMAKLPPLRRSVLFVCFAAEEQFLKGSRAFCEQPPVPREQVVANLNIEMIGRPEPGKEGKAWITGRELSDFAAIAEVGLQRAGVELVDFPMAKQLFAQSDNFSFVPYGIVAHSVAAGSLHHDYHQPSDEVGKLDIPHMTKIVRGLFEVVRDLADRDAKPVWNEAGEVRVDRLRKVPK